MQKSVIVIVMMLSLAALACNLGGSAVPTPTAAPVLTTPTLGLNPVVGAPGTVINVTAAGFPVGARVNLFLSPVSTPNNTPITTLTVGSGGILAFAMQLPDKIGTTPIGSNAPLVFTLSLESGGAGASAMFLALGTGQTTATPAGTGGTGNTGGTGGSDLFITSPPISSLLAGTAITVTGSGSAANNTVGVQVQDANGTVLGSANAVIQAAAGSVGPWQVTVGFAQPANAVTGFIVAFTSTQQASIPVSFTGGGGAQPNPQPTLAFPQPTTNGGPIVVTATKLFQ